MSDPEKPPVDQDIQEGVGGGLRFAFGEGHAEAMGDGVFIVFREGTSMVLTREDAERILNLC